MKTANGLYLEDFYLLRTPVYPIEYLLELNELLLDIDSETRGHDAIKKIKQKFSDPLFIEAIFYASKDLFNSLNNWLQDPVYDDKGSQKLIKSLHRYYSRMCTRCTPFGLFAGCSTGEIKASPTHLEVNMEDRIRRHVRVDAGLLAEMSAQLSNDPQFNRYIKFRLNDMMYRRGGKIAFLESIPDGVGNSYKISAISETKYLNFIISITGRGLYVQEIIDRLAAFDKSISKDRYEKYVQDLVSCQFLMSELVPNVTGQDYLERLKRFFDSNPQFDRWNAVLKHVQKIITHPARHKEYFTDVQDVIETLELHSSKKNSLQLDTHLQFQKNVLSKKIVEEIVETSAELWKINKPANTVGLNDFISRFKLRYEDQAIPILTALDSDVGIGYGIAVNGNTENMPLLSGVAFQSYELQSQTNKPKFQQFVERMHESFLQHRQPVITLKEEDVAEFINKDADDSGESLQFCSAFIFGGILSESANDLDNGNYKFVAAQLHNHSAGRMLGRFASGDEHLLHLLRNQTQKEELLNSGVILAEVVHAPAGHAINVAVRPAVRNYEIPILCSAFVEDEFIIPLQDLIVFTRNNRLVLFSQKHQKEVIPRITNAFNSQRGEPVYRLLADVAAQWTRPHFQWDWFDLYSRKFLPRIEYKKFILSRARWTLDQLDVRESEAGEYFQKLKESYRIPRYVVMVQDSDNELLIDTENPFCIAQLIRVLKKRSIILVEYFGMPENCFVTSGDYHFNNQVIIPLATSKRAFPLLSNAAIPSSHNCPRSFAPGSNWLYFKIYAGNKTLDLMLPSLLKPLIESLVENGIVEKWFFIRYNDPNSHLRIRFYCSDFKEIIDQFNTSLSPLIERNEIERFCIDTYKREIERYGPGFMEDSETLFYHDSIAVLNILDSIDGEEGDKIRWLAAVKSVDALLDDFKLPLAQKQQLLQSLSEMFFSEFATGEAKSDKRLKISLSNKYRANSADISNALHNAGFLESLLFSVFDQRSMANKDTANRIAAEMRTDDPSVFFSFLKSHIHMNVNRLFISKPRKHEMVLYHFLAENYRSQIAKQKAKIKTI